MFDGAGRRYRELTREADSLPPTERVARIAEIQSWFRNPSSETVLTPWKVVNRHLSDTIGGYCFFNEQFTGPNYIEVEPEPGSGKLLDYKETNEPRWVNQGKVTERVFRVADEDHSNLLEINSKSGLYPLYLVYTLYRKRLERYVEAQVIDSEIGLSLEEQQVIWDDAVSMCVHIICNTPMAEYITRRTLLGFRQCENEIDKAAFEASHPGQAGFIRSNLKIRNIDLVEQAKDKSKRPELIEKLRNPKFWSNINTTEPMTFDAIVSNPPYQINDGSGASTDAANPVYQYFVSLAKDLTPTYISFIIPSKWMVGGKVVLKPFRKEMMEDHHLRKFTDFENGKEIFPNANNDGGICFFLRDENHDDKLDYEFHCSNGSSQTFERFLNEDGYKTVIRDKGVSPILQKILQGKESFMSIVSKTKPFGIRKDVFNKPEKYISYNLSETPFDLALTIHGVKGIKGGARRTIGYIQEEAVSKNEEWINMYKLFFTTSYSSNALLPPEEIMAGPGVICTETFLVFGPFKTEQEQLNCQKYIHTTIFLSMLKQGHGSMQVSQNVFQYIPLQDFTAESDVPWDKSVAEIDQYLYKKYGLSQEEIDFIESMIRPME